MRNAPSLAWQEPLADDRWRGCRSLPAASAVMAAVTSDFYRIFSIFLSFFVSSVLVKCLCLHIPAGEVIILAVCVHSRLCVGGYRCVFLRTRVRVSVSVCLYLCLCVCKRVCTYCVCMYIWYMTCENFISSRPAQYPPKVVHLISHPGPPPAHRLIRLRGMVMPKKAQIIEVSKLYILARYYSEVRSCMPSCQDHCFMCWQRRHLHNNIIANMTWDREKGVGF